MLETVCLQVAAMAGAFLTLIGGTQEPTEKICDALRPQYAQYQGEFDLLRANNDEFVEDLPSFDETFNCGDREHGVVWDTGAVCMIVGGLLHCLAAGFVYWEFMKEEEENIATPEAVASPNNEENADATNGHDIEVAAPTSTKKEKVVAPDTTDATWSNAVKF